MNISSNSKYRSNKQYTLLTGATGLLGRYLMRDLLLQGVKLAVLVRPTKKQRVRERVESILQYWEAELGHRLPRPVIVTGDVCEKGLGLTPRQSKWCNEFVDQIIHSAAVLRFNSATRQEEPWLTNVHGTSNVIEVAESAKVRHFHFVSTAYVCGKRQENVLESELDEQQDFRNDYEASKFAAEKLVREANFETTTVYRPAVIVGDSQTGYTSTYHGLYLYLRFLDLLVPQQERNEDGVFETRVKLPIDGDEPRNLVPVDWVAKSICHLVRTPEAFGKTYHLSPEQGTTTRELIEFCYEYYNSGGVEFGGAGSERTADSEFAQKLFENTSIYASYETSEPIFDKRNMDRFAGHLVCPPIDKEMIFKFIEFGRNNNWGRGKTPAPKVGRWIEAHLTEIALAAQKTMGALGLNSSSHLFVMGLDIHGPGGGQWQLKSLDGRFEVSLGLPDESCPVLKLSDLQINDMLLQAHESQKTETDVAIDWTEPLETVMSSENQLED